MVETASSTPAQNASPAATGGPVNGAADIHHCDEKQGQVSHHPDSNEQESIERFSRRPSFMQNLADSRDAQFQRERLNELERYFVRDASENQTWKARADGQELFNSTDLGI